MSTIKLEIKGNFLKITDNINDNDRVMIKAITSYDFKSNDTILVLKQEQGTNQVSHKFKVSVLVDSTDTPFASLAALETFLSDNLGFNTGGGNGSGVTISQQALNYSAFVAGDNIGDLAYAEQSEGTKWLPGSLGGTYYPSGLYLWDGADWVSSRDAIALELNNLVGVTSTKTSNYNAINGDYLFCDSSGGEFTITLPPVASNTSSVVNVKKIDSSINNIIIDGNSTELVEFNETVSLESQGESFTLKCDGSAWYII